MSYRTGTERGLRQKENLETDRVIGTLIVGKVKYVTDVWDIPRPVMDNKKS